MKNGNLYDTIDEAQRRLLETVVLYEAEPYRVIAITNHKPDGIFRMYLWPVQDRTSPLPRVRDYVPGSAESGAYLDKWMTENTKSPLLRKMANSPAFNKFRPFSLGMMNVDGTAAYLERSPERRTQQGLVPAMVDTKYITLNPAGAPYRDRPSLAGPEFYDCVKGNYPSAANCLENLMDPSVENDSVAFHRSFAFVRGPLDSLFLSYKGDVVGFVPFDKSPQVELGKKYSYLKETIEETKQFNSIRVRV